MITHEIPEGINPQALPCEAKLTLQKLQHSSWPSISRAKPPAHLPGHVSLRVHVTASSEVAGCGPLKFHPARFLRRAEGSIEFFSIPAPLAKSRHESTTMILSNIWCVAPHPS